MGCNGSKLDDLQAVALCRDRSHLLSDAVRYRAALAEAHSAYILSLRSVGVSLHRFFVAHDGDPTGSPQLTIPSSRKGDDFPPPSPFLVEQRSGEAFTASSERLDSRSSSGSHLHFHSSGEEDSEYSDDGHLHFSDDSTPVEPPHNFPPFHHQQNAASTMYFNYARKGPTTPAVTRQQPAFNPNVYPVRVGTFGAGGVGAVNSDVYNPLFSNYPVYGGPSSAPTGAFGGYPYNVPTINPSSYVTSDGGSSSFSRRPVGASNRHHLPPPPPSPPRASAWEFFNPFDAYESYYYHRSYTPSKSSIELREEEGIPDLEDADSDVVRDNGDDNERHTSFATASSSSLSNGNGRSGSFSRRNGRVDSGRRTGKGMPHQTRKVSVKRSAGHGSNGMSNGVRQNSTGGSFREVVPNSRTVPDALSEIRNQFDVLSKCCEDVSAMLDVGKIGHSHEQHAEGEEMGVQSGNLSWTLQKLYVWEKKLHEEVRAEEKMRVQYEKKCRLLKHLDETGAEDQKIESTRAQIKKLSVRIKIAIQVVHSVSKRINKLRDEELWPQLNELIQGLVRMWQIMMECHGRQCQIAMEVQSLDRAVSGSAVPSDGHLEGTILLALEMVNWINAFSCWVGAQKSYVKALNGWLLKCIHFKPDITGVAQLSPSQLGAPPVFVISNIWSKVLDKTSENEVVEAMEAFATDVLQVWKHYYIEMRQRLLTNSDMANRLASLDREDQKVQKAVGTLNKRLARTSNLTRVSYADDIMQLSTATEAGNLQSSLKKMFQAMQRYANQALKAYQELCIHIERIDRDSADSS